MPDQPPTDPPSQQGARVRRALLSWRPGRVHLLVGLLLGLLGFTLVVQARQTQTEGLASLRQSDLVQILDNVSQRSSRLEEETRELQQTRDRLRSGSDAASAAEQAARERLEVLGILAGTIAATGPGIQLDIEDPDNRVTAAILLDAVQELRDAGAEAMQLEMVRVVASTSFVDGVNGVLVDGTRLTAPYRFLVIGDTQTLASALNIPGGVLDTLQQNGATGTVTPRDDVAVTALRQVSAPEYARPAPARSP